MSASPTPSSSNSRSKRTRIQAQLDSEGEYEQDIAQTTSAVSRKRKVTTSSAPVTATGGNKKEARMERNRQAAQASRDRRKAYTEELELKVQELEAKLLAATSTAPPTPSPTVDQDRLSQLEAENALLRSQLATSQSEGAQVQARMESFESKLEWLTQVMYNQQQQPQASTSSVLSPSLSVSPFELQQSVVSPSVSTLSLDPQVLLSSPTAIDPAALSLEASSIGTQQVESHVARVQFLPRISTCCSLPLKIFPTRCLPSQASAATLTQHHHKNNLQKRKWRHSLESLPSSNHKNRSNGTQSVRNWTLGFGKEDQRRKRFLILRFLSEKK